MIELNFFIKYSVNAIEYELKLELRCTEGNYSISF